MGKNNETAALRTEEAINTDLTLALDNYRSGVATDTAAQSAEKSAICKKLQIEMAETLTEGANLCDCGAKPHGMRVNRLELEVGCIICEPTYTAMKTGLDESEKELQTFKAARNVTIEKTVADWNAKIYRTKVIAKRPTE